MLSMDCAAMDCHVAPQSKECGCKGIRTCLLCQDPLSQNQFFNGSQISNNAIYQFCTRCQKAFQEAPYVDTAMGTSSLVSDACQIPVSVLPSSCCHGSQNTLDFPGIDIIENFITIQEEEELDKAIYTTPFAKSQSGRQKQDFGPKVNFKKQKLRTGTFNGLPSYSRFLYERMKRHKVIEDFEPVEMCNLEYLPERGAHIDPHIDDTWVWGEKLVTLNLMSDSVLSFTHDSHPDIVVEVPLTRRSLIVVSGPARYEWKHSICARHVSARRIAMTFRELADEFKVGARCVEGRELLEVALTFEGYAVGTVS